MNKLIQIFIIIFFYSLIIAAENPVVTVVSPIANSLNSDENTLIDIWNSDQRFRDSEMNKPAILPIEGKGRTFQSLVLKAIGRNITVKTVLDRLLKAIKTLEN